MSRKNNLSGKKLADTKKAPQKNGAWKKQKNYSSETALFGIPAFI